MDRVLELFQQGEKTADIYLIPKGVVKLVCTDAKGGQMIITLRFRHTLLGTPAVVLDATQPATAITISRCKLQRIPAEAFLAIADKSLAHLFQSFLLICCVLRQIWLAIFQKNSGAMFSP